MKLVDSIMFLSDICDIHVELQLQCLRMCTITCWRAIRRGRSPGTLGASVLRSTGYTSLRNENNIIITNDQKLYIDSLITVFTRSLIGVPHLTTFGVTGYKIELSN